MNSNSSGLDIKTITEHLRACAWMERSCIRVLAGWFLYVPAYEIKYQMGYHVWDHARHVSSLRSRLQEMRGGRPDASVSPALRRLTDEMLHAPNPESMLRGLYGVVKKGLLELYEKDLKAADRSANANEIKLIKSILSDLREHCSWYDSLNLEKEKDPWQTYIAALFDGALHERKSVNSITELERTGLLFERAKAIHFDDRIQKGDLTPYQNRLQMDARESTIEQFKVFFNEMYAAALLSTILFDSWEDGHPWEFYHDFCRHFWDEVRHSEFGSIRLKELGEEPSVCNQSLFEQSESLPVLHRICYLTRGLEAYFMPRKQPRVLEYEERGDHRSQLFADHDWSDEINHLRYGTTWTEYLLKDDYRTIENILDEVRGHLEKVTSRPQVAISAPF